VAAGAELLYLEMLDVEAEVVAHDLHPEYPATKWALEEEAELVGVQQHHAHAAACLTEHGETGPALAVVFDSTGLRHRRDALGRRDPPLRPRGLRAGGVLEPVRLPGGEAAIREPWRVAAVQLERAGLSVPFERWSLVRASLAVNAPLSSGMGRLFDAVAAVLGVRTHVTYEGQAAVELEQLAGDVEADPYERRLGDGSSLVAAVAADLAADRPREAIAGAFHETVAVAATDACAHAAEPRTVVLSGGTFQNLRLVESTRRHLERRGFRVLTRDRVPPNEGGISYGHAAVTAAALGQATRA
jgi:hydrogenase maturation protein HypF